MRERAVHSASCGCDACAHVDHWEWWARMAMFAVAIGAGLALAAIITPDAIVAAIVRLGR